MYSISLHTALMNTSCSSPTALTSKHSASQRTAVLGLLISLGLKHLQSLHRPQRRRAADRARVAPVHLFLGRVDGMLGYYCEY